MSKKIKEDIQGKGMYYIIRFLLTGLLLTFFLLPVEAGNNSFEGHISFVKKTYFDTVYINFYIKENKARISYYSKDGVLLHSLLADIDEETVFAIDPERKMYKQLNIREESHLNTERLKIIKSGNFRQVNGVKCYQWRVRDRKTNSEIAYWVAQKDLDFMNELISLIARTDKIYQFFSEIPSTDGYFPMLSVERNLLRKERQRIMVREIVSKEMDDSLFAIPETYVEFSP